MTRAGGTERDRGVSIVLVIIVLAAVVGGAVVLGSAYIDGGPIVPVMFGQGGAQTPTAADAGAAGSWQVDVDGVDNSSILATVLVDATQSDGIHVTVRYRGAPPEGTTWPTRVVATTPDGRTSGEAPGPGSEQSSTLPYEPATYQLTYLTADGTVVESLRITIAHDAADEGATDGG